MEDIIDTGHTFHYITENLKTRRPKSLRICTLLTKPSRREIEIPLDYGGFEIPNKFVIDYGLDFAEIYRSLPYIRVLKKEKYEKTHSASIRGKEIGERICAKHCQERFYLFLHSLFLAIATILLWTLPGSGHTVATAPNSQRFEVSGDTWINSWFPNTNCSYTIWLYFRADGQHVPLLKFDVSAIPPGSAIIVAHLYLYVPPDLTLENYRVPCELAAYCVKKEWLPEEATWNRASSAQPWEISGCMGEGTSAKAMTLMK